jgi:hypothetical protein
MEMETAGTTTHISGQGQAIPQILIRQPEKPNPLTNLSNAATMFAAARIPAGDHQGAGWSGATGY